MAQDILLLAASRALSLHSIYKAGKEAAYQTFCEMRWAEGEAVCLCCGYGEAYKITTRRKLKCKACHHQFSVTSGTIFVSCKLQDGLCGPIGRDLHPCECAQGRFNGSTVPRSGLSVRDGFLLSRKLREAMAQKIHTGKVLEGHVEIDGAYFGGHIRLENAEKDRKDRRLKRHQTGKRRVVVAMRERDGRTLPFVGMSEAEGVALVNENVSRPSTMSANEASHWDELHMGYHLDRINHSENYCDHGKHTNMVESFFSRLCRMVQSQHRHVSPKYLH